MNISNYEYRSIATCIERIRSTITANMIKMYPYSEFDEGAEIANNPEINQLYQLLDDAITKEEMEKIYPPKKYDQRKHKSQPSFSDHQSGNASR